MGSPPPQRDDPLENEVSQIIVRLDHALAEAAKLHEDLARLTAPEPVLSQGDRTGSGRGQVEPHDLPASGGTLWITAKKTSTAIEGGAEPFEPAPWIAAGGSKGRRLALVLA